MSSVTFLAPGSDGELPADFDEWRRRGLICTVDPRLLAPLVAGEEYRINITTRHKIAEGKAFASYETLYRRATSLARARLAEATCAQADTLLHRWVVAHSWFRMPIPDAAIVGATVTFGVMYAVEGQDLPHGVDAPAPEALTAPYVAQLAAIANDSDPSRRLDEFYNEFDFRYPAPPDDSIVTLSYGEYVAACAGIEFEPLVRRAEHRARFLYDSLAGDSAAAPFRIVRREWSGLDTGRNSKPTLAHVNIYFEA